MQNVIRSTRFLRISKIANRFTSKRIVNTYGFSPCPRETCYCYELIRRPEKTKITKKLIKNAYKCKDEYHEMQDLVDMLNKR